MVILNRKHIVRESPASRNTVTVRACHSWPISAAATAAALPGRDAVFDRNRVKRAVVSWGGTQLHNYRVPLHATNRITALLLINDDDERGNLSPGRLCVSRWTQVTHNQ